MQRVENARRMKRSVLALLAATGGVSMLAWPHAAQATSFTWDSNANADSGPLDGAGSWDNANLNWWNGAANVAWNNANADTAVFGAGGTGGAVTLGSAGVTIGGLTIN